jgi:hypothetical protein
MLDADGVADFLQKRRVCLASLHPCNPTHTVYDDSSTRRAKVQRGLGRKIPDKSEPLNPSAAALVEIGKRSLLSCRR